MKDFLQEFTVKDSKKIDLEDYSTDESYGYQKEDAEGLLKDLKAEMSELQEKLYATSRYSLLLIFQAMDAGGKDSAIEHVMSGINPQGCQVFSFKQPTSEELKHDFLWRHTKALPEKGRIGIHNRSHYENVLICKVHPELVLNEGTTSFKSVTEIDGEFWNSRYESIRDFEKHLARNGTIIIKFFLHVSKKEQKERFLERIDDPLKNWKFSSVDVEERAFWDDYMRAYEVAITETASRHAPWYIIPADRKWFARLAISKIIVETLRSIDLGMPELSDEEKGKLAECKKHLLSEG